MSKPPREDTSTRVTITRGIQVTRTLQLCETQENLRQWNLHLSVAAGCGSIDGRNDKLHVRPYIGPLLFAYENNCNFPACEVLRIPNVFVSGQNDLKTCGFCRVKKIAVLKCVPSFMRGGADGVAG